MVNGAHVSGMAAYDKLVAAGMKIMFDKSTHHLMQEQMAAEGEISDKLSEGVATLISMMLKNSRCSSYVALAML